MTIEDVIEQCLARGNGATILTLDRGFQGLPDTAHGGSVLAVFDRLAGGTGPREVLGVYRRRVPLGVPLEVVAERRGRSLHFSLNHERTVLVDGAVTHADPVEGVSPVPDGPVHPLPVSSTCFACGVGNEIGLRLSLQASDHAVVGTHSPRGLFGRGDGSVASVVLTTLLDETAFWLGALASGESGMTTDVRVALHRPAPSDARLVVSGLRARVTPGEADPRYWRTITAVHDEGGALVASGRITFVAVRGAARRLVAGMLAMNAPDTVRRVFPAYT